VSCQRAAEFRTAIAAIRKDVSQPRIAIANGLEQVWCPVTILNISTVDDYEQHQSEGVSDDVTLAAFDVLAFIIAANPAAFGGFDRLAIDCARRGAGFTAFQFPRADDEQSQLRECFC